MNENIERELGWDDEIEKESEFVILPAGDYPFKVESFERARFDGSDKMPACPMAILKIRIDGPDHQVSFVNHRLLLHSRCEWSLSEFFAGIGQKKKGEKLKMNWQMVAGTTGRCKVAIREYNGDQYNEIKKFYPKDESYVASSPLQQNTAQSVATQGIAQGSIAQSGNKYTAGKF